MAVNLYRRHKPDCVGGHEWQSRSSELEERRKTWRRCDCLIHASATLNGKFSRKSTGTSDWSAARQWAAELEEAGSWDGIVVPPTPEPLTAPVNARVTVVDACAAFITNRESAQIAPATLRKYRTFTKQFGSFADSCDGRPVAPG
jgi:hypothetical protein